MTQSGKQPALNRLGFEPEDDGGAQTRPKQAAEEGKKHHSHTCHFAVSLFRPRFWTCYGLCRRLGLLFRAGYVDCHRSRHCARILAEEQCSNSTITGRHERKSPLWAIASYFGS